MKVRYATAHPFMIIPDRIWEIGLSQDAFILYSRLVHHANHGSRKAWPSRRTLGSIVCPGRSARQTDRRIDAAIKELISCNMIEKDARKRSDGSQSANCYCLTSETSWTEKLGGVSSDDTGGSVTKRHGGECHETTLLEPDPSSNQIHSEPDPRDSFLTRARSAPALHTPMPTTSAPLFERLEQEPSQEEQREKKPVDERKETAPVVVLTEVVSNDSAPQKRVPKPKAVKEPTAGARVWDAYSRAYVARYSTAPIRNAKQNGLCSQLAQRLGELAPAVAAFYVGHPNGFYAGNMHALGLCLKDAESLAVQMQRNERMTQTKARQVDKHGAMSDVMARAMEGINRRAEERIARGEPE